MFGILLALLATLFLEVSTVIGKTEADSKKEGVYLFGFLSIFWSTIWFLIIILFRDGFSFSSQSILTLSLRIILEIIIADVVIRGIFMAERSTYTSIRAITIPLLLLVDLWLGYVLSIQQIVGMGVIALTLIIGFYSHAMNTRGLKFVALGALFSVVNISLYKYNITHYNSVETEQFIVSFFLLIYFLIRIQINKSGNPFRFLIKKPFASQSLTHGVATVIGSFAFLFAPASIILAGERSLSILWGMLSGNLYFKEKHFFLKMFVLVFLGLGLFLLIPS